MEQHNIRPKFTAEEILLNFRIFSSTLQSFGSRGLGSTGPCGAVAKTPGAGLGYCWPGLLHGTTYQTRHTTAK